MKYTFQKSLGRLTQQVSKGLGRILEKKFQAAGYSVTASQWSVISYLSQKNMATQKEIGNFLGVNKVMIKRIIDKLEGRGLVKRIPSSTDKRYNQIDITNKGLQLYNELVPFAEETLKEAYKGIDANSIENCLHTLGQISQKIDHIK
jgi:DNA-binding MarR family transcriptional regulator